MDWRPIETAPKNGDILGYHVVGGSGGYMVVWWDMDQWVMDYTHEEGKPVGPPGHLTHWMPLPEPPVAGASSDAVRFKLASDPFDYGEKIAKQIAEDLKRKDQG